MIKKLFLFLLVGFYCNSIAKVIIWDLGGVICATNKWGMAYEIGLFKPFMYLLLDWKNPAKIQKLLFQILSEVETPEIPDFKLAVIADGTPMPYIVCQYQAGKKRGPDAIAQAKQYIEKLPENRFSSNREKDLIIRTIEVMFNPDILARNTYMIPEGVALFKEVCEARNADNSTKNKCIACSNWDAVSFHKFALAHENVFNLFEGRIEISGINHLLKPNPETYIALLKKYSLNPEDCLFIDDQEINVQAAQAVGIPSLCLKNGNYRILRDELQRREVI